MTAGGGGGRKGTLAPRNGFDLHGWTFLFGPTQRTLASIQFSTTALTDVFLFSILDVPFLQKIFKRIFYE